MIYDIRQTTICTYASPVANARHILRLTPIGRPRQQVRVASLQIIPEPSESREGRDFFGNHVTWIAFEQPHNRLTVKVAARVGIDEMIIPNAAATPAFETERERVAATDNIGPMSPAQFLFPSRMVSLDPEIRDYTRGSFPTGRSVLDGAIDLMRRINADMVYDTHATTVTTTAPMSFALRRGVCQDFAHIMISGLRGIGLPAAYVSGYLRTAPRQGSVGLVGADAMHAWVLAWCGSETGWVGLDPTNAVFASDDHVTLAVGRDYSDVAPIDGVILASGGQRIDVAVNVIPVI